MLQRVENECESKFDILCLYVYNIVNKPINAFFIHTNRLKQLESLKYWLKTSIKHSRLICYHLFRSVYVDDSDDDFSDPTPARAQVFHVQTVQKKHFVLYIVSTIIVALTSHNSFVCIISTSTTSYYSKFQPCSCTYSTIIFLSDSMDKSE